MREISRNVVIPLVEKVEKVPVKDRQNILKGIRKAHQSLGDLIPLGKVIVEKENRLQELYEAFLQEIPDCVQDRDRMAWTYALDFLYTYQFQYIVKCLIGTF